MSIFGVGINDADYFISKKEKSRQIWMCPYYKVWKSMIARGYSKKFKKKYPSYMNVTVCGEWHYFMNFRSWMMTQDWKGKHLDKDILIPGNNVYSPDFCVFVDGIVNTFPNENLSSRGELPIGVSWSTIGRKFVSRCRNPFTKKMEHLGLFSCQNLAHMAWKKRKHELACNLADLQEDKRVAEALKARYRDEVL